MPGQGYGMPAGTGSAAAWPASALPGTASGEIRGSQDSHRGRYQFRSPSRVITDASQLHGIADAAGPEIPGIGIEAGLIALGIDFEPHRGPDGQRRAGRPGDRGPYDFAVCLPDVDRVHGPETVA